MSSTYARNATTLGSGTQASPATLAASASVTTATVTIGNGSTGNNQPEGKIRVVLNIGSSVPATAPTVTFYTSIDGTNFAPVATYVSPNLASTINTFDFVPDIEDQATYAVIANGGTNSITYWAQAGTIGGP